jgi:hypothetical protein
LLQTTCIHLSGVPSITDGELPSVRWDPGQVAPRG